MFHNVLNKSVQSNRMIMVRFSDLECVCTVDAMLGVIQQLLLLLFLQV